MLLKFINIFVGLGPCQLCNMTGEAQELCHWTNVEVFDTYIPQQDFQMYHQG